MSPRSLLLMLVAIVVLFAGVWGGGWYALTASRQRAKDEAAAAEQAKLDAERKQRQAAEQARAEEEEKQRREDAAAKAASKSKAANKAAKAKAEKQRADSREKRIALLTMNERFYLQEATKDLPKKRLKECHWAFDPNAMAFLVTYDDLFPEGLVDHRLCELADDCGVAAIIKDQEIVGAGEQKKCKVTFALLAEHERKDALEIIKIVNKDGLDGLGDRGKVFVRNHPALYPKYHR